MGESLKEKMERAITDGFERAQEDKVRELNRMSRTGKKIGSLVQRTGLTIRAVMLIAIIFLFIPSFANAQWKCVLRTDSCEFWIIQFLDLPGPPRIGYAGGIELYNSGGDYDYNYNGVVFKTTDGGDIWKKVELPPDPFGDSSGAVSSVTFKDTLTGWAAAERGCYKTTDGGDSWFWSYFTLGTTPWEGSGSIYYDHKTGGLFFECPGFYGNYAVSWDEGTTWQQWDPPNNDGSSAGFAFANDDSGIVVSQSGYPWIRTKDGGLTWAPINIDSTGFQPLAIRGTTSYFGCTQYGYVLRTDDVGNTWNLVHTFPWPLVAYEYDSYPLYCPGGACIQGDFSNLFVMLSSGCYRSTDTGKNWSYLCGMPYYSTGEGWDEFFYAKGGDIYIISRDTSESIWFLNLDSMQYFGTGLTFSVNSKRVGISAGKDVTINFSANQDQIGIDSGHIVIHFDSYALRLKSLQLPPSWVIVDSSLRNGILDLRITADSNAALPSPIITLTFNTYLSTPSTKVYLDSAHLYGKRLNCDCEALSTANSDSVEIDFTGYGDSILLAAMQGQPPFSIESIQPNPASSIISVTVSGDRVPGSGIEIEMFDVLGNTVLTQHSALSTQHLDVSSLAEGVYILRAFTPGSIPISRKLFISR